MATEILLAEDNPADVYLVRQALQAHGLTVTLHVVRDGESAINFIEAAEQHAASLHLAVLDLNLPRVTGLEVLARLRSSAKYGNIPVAMISSSRSSKDSVAIADLRANHFFTKPSDYAQFMMLGEVIKHLLEGAGQIGRSPASSYP